MRVKLLEIVLETMPPCTIPHGAFRTNDDMFFGRCLNRFNFVCRYAAYDTQNNDCYLSNYTVPTREMPNVVFMENVCLTGKHKDSFICAEFVKILVFPMLPLHKSDSQAITFMITDN